LFLLSFIIKPGAENSKLIKRFAPADERLFKPKNTQTGDDDKQNVYPETLLTAADNFAFASRESRADACRRLNDDHADQSAGDKPR